MKQVDAHWTNESIEDFQHSVAANFIRFLEDSMEDEQINQAELAAKLGVTPGRVSQVLSNPGNLTLRRIIEYSRALNRKVSIVGYNDGDTENRHGPIVADIFSECWEHLGRPKDFFDLEESIRDRSRAHAEIKPP